MQLHFMAFYVPFVKFGLLILLTLVIWSFWLELFCLETLVFFQSRILSLGCFSEFICRSIYWDVWWALTICRIISISGDFFLDHSLILVLFHCLMFLLKRSPIYVYVSSFLPFILMTFSDPFYFFFSPSNVETLQVFELEGSVI